MWFKKHHEEETELPRTESDEKLETALRDNRHMIRTSDHVLTFVIDQFIEEAKIKRKAPK